MSLCCAVFFEISDCMTTQCRSHFQLHPNSGGGCVFFAIEKYSASGLCWGFWWRRLGEFLGHGIGSPCLDWVFLTWNRQEDSTNETTNTGILRLLPPLGASTRLSARHVRARSRQIELSGGCNTQASVRRNIDNWFKVKDMTQRWNAIEKRGKVNSV